MGEAGAALQGCNAALLEGLAELRARRDELSERIREEEAERGRLQARLGALSQRLARTNESLAGHLAARSELDRSIAETEAAYGKHDVEVEENGLWDTKPSPSLFGRGERKRRKPDTARRPQESTQILESSQTLLDVLKGEIGNASKASEPKSTSKQKEKQTSGQKHS